MLLDAKLQNVLGRKKTSLQRVHLRRGHHIATLSLDAPTLLFGRSLLEGVCAALIILRETQKERTSAGGSRGFRFRANSRVHQTKKSNEREVGNEERRLVGDE